MVNTFSRVEFANNVELTNGSHILYTYQKEDIYINKVVYFISNGLKLGQGVVYIDKHERYNLIRQKLQEEGYNKELLNSIIFSNCEEFYKFNNVVNFNRLNNTFTKAIQSFVDNGISVRTWANIEWQEDDSVLERLITHEKESDDFVGYAKTFTVCAYNGKLLSSFMQIDLMKSHQYFMTDTELFTSSLYTKSQVPSIYLNGSLEEALSQLRCYQAEILRLEKFETVAQMSSSISHEVRNPMTTVRGFCRY
ncbi:hypothetical protein N752_21170 [Desulforamulus aquiferis]|nr:MEDS domain-containing protein [Desulforamulus aquiferis]RYD03346.1 hypothetical protein N752_21170 [Desulforamulus aquiferis]